MMQWKLGIAAVILLINNITITDSQSGDVGDPNRIRNNESSCNSIKYVILANWTVLLKRSCMCTEDCKIYKDCCKDSIHYNEAEQSEESIFQCHPKYKVYMIASCPSSYPSSPLTRIREKCENSSFHISPMIGNSSTDYKSLFNPVSVISKSITFANLYCASCHGEGTYVKWNFSNTCWAVNDVPSNISANSDGSYYHLDKNRNLNCFYKVDRPKSLTDLNGRPCVPAISTCEIDKNLQNICSSYTAYVKDDDGRIYKNAVCAQCNKVINTSPSYYNFSTSALTPVNGNLINTITVWFGVFNITGKGVTPAIKWKEKQQKSTSKPSTH